MKIFTFHDQVGCLILLRTKGKLLLNFLTAGLDTADDAPRRRLAFVVQAQASGLVGIAVLEKRDQLLAVEGLVVPEAH